MQQRLGCSTQVVAITAWSFPANLPSLTYLLAWTTDMVTDIMDMVTNMVTNMVINMATNMVINIIISYSSSSPVHGGIVRGVPI